MLYELTAGKLLECATKLVGARGTLHSATNAVETCYYLLRIHADNELGKSLCVAVATAMEMALAYLAVLQTYLYILATGTFRLIEQLLLTVHFGRYIHF